MWKLCRVSETPGLIGWLDRIIRTYFYSHSYGILRNMALDPPHPPSKFPTFGPA